MRLPQSNQEWNHCEPQPDPEPQPRKFPDISPEERKTFQRILRASNPRMHRRERARTWWCAWALGFLCGAIVTFFMAQKLGGAP